MIQKSAARGEESVDRAPRALTLGTRQLEFLRGFSKIRAEHGDAPETALRWLAEALPGACRQSETVCARVTLDGHGFATANFEETSARRRAPILVGETVRGELELGRLGRSLQDLSLSEDESALLEEAAREAGLYVRRVEAETALRKRERVLDAVTRITADLMAASSLDAKLPGALRRIGESIGAHRVMVLQSIPSPDGGILVQERGLWNAPGVDPAIRIGEWTSRPEAAGILGGFLASLKPAQIVALFPRQTQSPLGELLRGMNVRSFLLVPILVDGKPWGHLGFQDCHQERIWIAAETDALRVLGEIVGASFTRAHHSAELADAQRIVENSTTVLYRTRAEPGMPLSYISENISKWEYTAAQFLAEPFFYHTIIHPEDLAKVEAWIQALLADTGAPSWLIFRIRLADGHYRWFENRIAAIRDESGRPRTFEGMLFDITDRKQAEDQFNFMNTLFITAMENAPTGFLVVGSDRRILTCNRRFLDMGRIPQETHPSKLDHLLWQAVEANLKDPQKFRDELERWCQHPEHDLHDEFDFRDGRVFERNSAALRGHNQDYLGRMFFFRDITERKRTEREMLRLARTDPLTGLANRSVFLDRLGLALAASRRGDTPFAVHYVDLDNFKDVNDSLGHHAGDGLLKAVSQRMAGAVRETDLVARFGGDEFSILQSDVADPSTAGALAAKLRALLAEPYTIEGNVLRVTATVGIALYTPEVVNAAEILTQADRALYRAKEEGRNRYRFHSQELDALVHERVNLADELRAGIDRGELELHYLPQVNVGTGRIVGVEALVRWNHPRLGLLAPGVFLAAAERTGAMLQLGSWVLDKACQQFRLWRDQGLQPPSISVNLSASQLKMGRDFYRDVQKTLQKWDLAPRDLEFDVAEEVLSRTAGSHFDVLQNLHELGVRIAIDDFGEEFTSIGRLRAYQVKRLKIAPQLIQSMTLNPADAGAVRLMLHLAAHLGIEIIAKSVETQEQQAFLLASAEGALAQGFFYSQPLPSEGATAFLRQNLAAGPPDVVRKMT